MSLANITLLGILQGLTEFLPISSSGHLVLAKTLLAVKEPGVIIETSLHLGTMMAIILIYRTDFLGLIRSAVPVRADENTSLYRKYLWLIAVGTIPAVFFGLFFKSAIENIFNSSMFVGFALMITAALLLVGRKLSGSKDLGQIGYLDAFIIGMWQAFAILPGISRSGSTIVGSMLRGVKPETSARFSLMLSVPAVLGANIVALKDVSLSGLSNFYLLAAGTLVSFVVGLLAIKLLLRAIAGGKLGYFAVYCFVIGIITVLLGFL